MAKSRFQTPRHILVITPVEDMGVILRLSLEQISNVRTSVVSSVTQAVDLAVASHPDLLLLDTDAVEEEQLLTLRAIPVLQRIPMVFLVSRVRAGDRQQSAQLGINSILAKPFDPSELIKQVNTGLINSPLPLLMAVGNA